MSQLEGNAGRVSMSLWQKYHDGKIEGGGARQIKPF